MAAHGRSVRRSGATPTATSQLQLKAVSAGAARYWPEDRDSDNLPPRVIYQVQHQMRVAERERCIVFVGIPLETRVYEVLRREEIIEPLMELEHKFWEHVMREEYPDDVRDEDAETFIRAFGVREAHIGMSIQAQDIVDAYELISSQIREAEIEKKRLRDRIVSGMGGNRYGHLPDGRTIDCNLIQVKERVQTVKAHTQLRLNVKRPDDGGR